MATKKLQLLKGSISTTDQSTVFYVTVTAAEDGTFTADKTYDEILSVYNGRRDVYACYYYDGFNLISPLIGSGDIFTFDFMLDVETRTIRRVWIRSDGSVASSVFNPFGDIETALDELHAYAQGLISGGETA